MTLAPARSDASHVHDDTGEQRADCSGDAAAVLELAITQVAEPEELRGIFRPELERHHDATRRLPFAIGALAIAAAGRRRRALKHPVSRNPALRAH
jgi:hypothetical protein